MQVIRERERRCPDLIGGRRSSYVLSAVGAMQAIRERERRGRDLVGGGRSFGGAVRHRGRAMPAIRELKRS